MNHMDANKNGGKKFDPTSLYPKPKTYDEVQLGRQKLRENRENVRTNKDGGVISIGRGAVVNLVLSIMFVTTMVCCIAVLALGDDGKPLDSVDMINVRAYTIPMFVAIFAGIIALPKIIGTYKLTYFELTLAYLIYAVAAGYTAVFMTKHGVFAVVTYGLLFILSQLYVWSVFAAFNYGFSVRKLRPAVGVIAFLALLALFL